jgi:hypothetical protein
MPEILQFRAQFREVVDFAVENDPNGPIFVVDGLVATGEVDNAKTSHPQSDIVSRKHTLVIGPAMDNASTHLLNFLR